MTATKSQPDDLGGLDAVLGYLNFSSGAPDGKFQQGISDLFRFLGQQPESSDPAWLSLRSLLTERLANLQETADTFARADQAEHVIRLVFDHVLPAYRRHHRDLLFHQSDEQLFQPFFLARVFEEVLLSGAPWEEESRIERVVLARLNDFVGHRPVAVLRTEQRIEPYPHERVRPIPLYIRGAGTACGDYEPLIRKSLDILEHTDPDLLRQAWFDPQLLDEWALDPRAYDFDHPVHRRLNHQFGGWDPDHLDGQGQYRRFVLRQVTVDALLERVHSPGELSYDEALFEAAAVLSGTVLMASGTSGSGPDVHDSSVTTATLVRHIAAYRDEFYLGLLKRLPKRQARRLKAESEQQGQPFAGARQHLNRCLSRLRARQLQHVHLAELFARMGYPEAAMRQAGVVPVASARMVCEIDCRLAAGQDAVRNRQLKAAADEAREVEDLLHRGIECGALVDPWNILGFQGQFSLTPALEDSVVDHRVDVLLQIVDQLLGLYVRLSAEAAAEGDAPLGQSIDRRLRELAAWWDCHAAGEIAAVDGVSGQEAVESASHLAESLGVWHRAGEAAGDIAFWRQHVTQFTSPKSYALVVEALLEKRDFLGSMALLVQWAAQAEQVSLDEDDHSFHLLVQRWMTMLWTADTDQTPDQQRADVDEAWKLTCKCLDYLEANAEEYWHVPEFEFDPSVGTTDPADDEATAGGDEDDEDEDAEDLYSAAYDEMTYRDSTDDGLDADMLEGGTPTDYELDHEALRIGRRLAFLATVARLWKTACLELWSNEGTASQASDRRSVLETWHARAEVNCRRLDQLLAAVNRYAIPAPRGTHESLAEYDRRNIVKESTLGDIIATRVDTTDAARWLLAAGMPQGGPAASKSWQRHAVELLSALLRHDSEAAAAGVPLLIKAIESRQTLFVPLSKGGQPSQMVETQSILRLFSQLLSGLPRAGLLNETYALLTAAQRMEKNHPGGPSVTSFERLFEVAFKGIVECLTQSYAAHMGKLPAGQPLNEDTELIEYLQHAAEPLLKRWLEHSRGVRLSVMERARDDEVWQELVAFIKRYGQDLFTQPLLQVARLRSILHHGVGRWLESLAEEPEPEVGSRLLEDLGGPLEESVAVRNLGLVLEAISENYSTYCDYNTTTTHSDHGEMLYTLLDFLRLLASYNRFAWNLKPLVDAHRVLVEAGRGSAAAAWRQEFAKRTTDIADWHQARLDELRAAHGMRLSSLADRLGERFVRPLAIDRVCALVRPAVLEARRRQPGESFSVLTGELEEFTDSPAGSAVDIPDWLVRLEEELHAIEALAAAQPTEDDVMPQIDRVILTWDDACRQIDSWHEP